MSHDHPVWAMLDRMQMDLRELSARMVELRAHVAALELPDEAPRFTCETCKRADFRSVPALEEHAYIHHDGPLPERDRRAEELANWLAQR